MPSVLLVEYIGDMDGDGAAGPGFQLILPRLTPLSRLSETLPPPYDEHDQRDNPEDYQHFNE